MQTLALALFLALPAPTQQTTVEELPLVDVVPLLDFCLERVAELETNVLAARNAHLLAMAAGATPEALADLQVAVVRAGLEEERIVSTSYFTSDNVQTQPMSGLLWDLRRNVAYDFVASPDGSCSLGLLDLQPWLLASSPLQALIGPLPSELLLGAVLRLESYGAQLSRNAGFLAEQRSMWIQGRQPMFVPTALGTPDPEGGCPIPVFFGEPFDERAGLYALRKLESELFGVADVLLQMLALAERATDPSIQGSARDTLDAAFQQLDDEVNRLATGTRLFGNVLLSMQDTFRIAPDDPQEPLFTISSADVSSATLGVDSPDLTTVLNATAAVQIVETALGPAIFGPFTGFLGVPFYVRRLRMEREQF